MEPFEASLPPDLTRLSRLRHELTDWLKVVGASPDQRGAVVLAIHEAAANAIEHARGKVTVRGVRDQGRLLLIVSNTGSWTGSRSQDIGRGSGLALMHALMSNIEINVDPDRTTVRMRLDISESDKPVDRESCRATLGLRRGVAQLAEQRSPKP